MKLKPDRCYVWVFVGLVMSMSLLLFIFPVQAFSNIENRSLQEMPPFTWQRLWSKQYMKDFEGFVTDQFPFRTQWVSMKSSIEQARLQQENNAIYRGKDGYLFEKFAAPDYTLLEQYTDAVNQLALNHPDVQLTFLLAPNSIGLYPERLPWLASAYPQREVHNWIAERVGGSLNFLDGFDFLTAAKDDEKPLYYRTDHHWTTYGAYLAYKAYAAERSWKALEMEEFDVRTVSQNFLGSFHTRSLFSGLEPDRIEVFSPKKSLVTNMYIADTDQTVKTMYEDGALQRKDQYAYFLGGVHALMRLTTDHGQRTPDQKKLLVIKDSYAHNLLPFLTQHVAEIHVIDVRLYNGSISDYMEKNEMDDVLLLFNTTTFITEHNAVKLKY